VSQKTLADVIIGGWQISGVVIVQSGQPFTAVMPVDNSYSLAGSNYDWYPNLIGNPKLQGGGPNRWFNKAAFAAPAAGTFGNEHRNQLTVLDSPRLTYP